MMKNVLYTCLLALAFCACEQKDSFLYEDKAGLYFYVPELEDWETENPNALVKEVDFAFAYNSVMTEWGQPIKYYYGDSLRIDTIEVIVSLLGKIPHQSREYYLKATLTEMDGFEPLPESALAFENPYVFPADSYLDTIKIFITRPEKRGEYVIGLTFDSKGDFESNVSERNILKLKVSDRYPRPDGWNDETSVYGKYTEEKYAFFVTVLNQKYLPERDDNMWAPYPYILRTALEEYNAAHPDAPKDFTFPGMD